VKKKPERPPQPAAGEKDLLSPELAALLTTDEREVLRAARQHARLTGVTLWDVSSQIIGTTHAELDARKLAEKIGVEWPALPEWTSAALMHTAPAMLADFIKQCWGDLLVAIVAARARPRISNHDLFASPTVRVLLVMLRDGLDDGRPEFEDVARQVAALLSPVRTKGLRTGRTIAEEEAVLSADFYFRAFKTIVDWTTKNRPRRLGRKALLAYLNSEPRPYSAALAAAGFLPGARMHHEDELLVFVVDAVTLEGTRSSARNAAFHGFALARGFAAPGSTPSGFLRTMRQAVRDIRYRKARFSKPHPEPGITHSPAAERAGRNEVAHRENSKPDEARPQPPESRRAARLPTGRRPGRRRSQPQPPPLDDRPRRDPRRSPRKGDADTGG